MAQTAVIANGASLSGAIRCPSTPRLLHIPTITSAAISFEVSLDGSTFAPLFSTAGDEVSMLASTGGRIVCLEADIFAGVKWLKIRSGTSGTPVNQGAERTFTLTCEPSTV